MDAATKQRIDSIWSQLKITPGKKKA